MLSPIRYAGGRAMHDLRKVEEKFHEFIEIDRYPDRDELRITESLLTQQEAVYIPFGWMTYFLVIEDGRPVLYAHAISRMDLDSICFIDENGHKCYDIFCGDNMEIYEKYRRKSENVRGYDELKGLPKRK